MLRSRRASAPTKSMKEANGRSKMRNPGETASTAMTAITKLPIHQLRTALERRNLATSGDITTMRLRLCDEQLDEQLDDTAP
eukprot:CAMPEP_0185808836 /NCGR_PEP_ID=MMETSP1322-20130828/5847_1 /TAXON_ID=265543 /ORGANISM="Minutocellus polymorphus, Strain RCC2270" /LENGTH=81 /DNA_ID=CAMNT_0028505077 /DNA_START=24 /DNA_END=265 /DNA_ORIENTATION=-